MIGKIRGRIDEIDGNEALIETTSGVFYRVHLTNALLGQYPPGSDIVVYTYHHIREDTQLLFGFSDSRTYKLFLLLLSVSGVGPKSAYSIVAHSSVDELVRGVRSNDVSVFTKIPGLGKKTALKIILELSSKFKSEFVLEQSYVSEDDQVVIDALMSLGFSPSEANEILPKLDKELSMEEKIKQAITKLSRSNF